MMHRKAHEACVKGTPPDWQKLMASCRYCGSLGSPDLTKGCMECTAYKAYFNAHNIYAQVLAIIDESPISHSVVEQNAEDARKLERIKKVLGGEHEQ